MGVDIFQQRLPYKFWPRGGVLNLSNTNEKYNFKTARWDLPLSRVWKPLLERSDCCSLVLLSKHQICYLARPTTESKNCITKTEVQTTGCITSGALKLKCWSVIKLHNAVHSKRAAESRVSAGFRSIQTLQQVFFFNRLAPSNRREVNQSVETSVAVFGRHLEATGWRPRVTWNDESSLSLTACQY